MKVLLLVLLLCSCFGCSGGTKTAFLPPTEIPISTVSEPEPVNTDSVESLHLSAIAFLYWGDLGMTAQFTGAPQTSIAMEGNATPPSPVRANITTRICGDMLVLWSLNEVAFLEHQEGFWPGKFTVDPGKRIIDAIFFQEKVYVLVESGGLFYIEIHGERGDQEGEISLKSLGEESEFSGLLTSNDRLYLVQKGVLNATFIKDPSLIEVDPTGSLGEIQSLEKGMIKGQIYGNGNTVHYVKEDESGRYQVNYHPLAHSRIQAAPQGKNEYPYLGAPIGIGERNHIYGRSGWSIGKVDAGNRLKGSVALENAFVMGDDIWFSYSEGEEVIVFSHNGFSTVERYRINVGIDAVRKFNFPKLTFRGFGPSAELMLSGRVPGSSVTQTLTFDGRSGEFLGTSSSQETILNYHHQLTTPENWSVDSEGGIWMASLGPAGVYIFRGELR